jgi:hypothetical protein
MAILGLSAARELLIEVPIERRIAALRNNSTMQKILFITYLPGSTYADDLLFLVYPAKYLKTKS